MSRRTRVCNWAKLSHITALLLEGRRTEAVAMAKDLAAWLRARPIERESSKDNLIRASVIIGDDERVEKMAKETAGDRETLVRLRARPRSRTPG